MGDGVALVARGQPVTPGIYLLAASLAGNAALGWAYLGQRDEAATVALERDAARSHASACSDATDALRELADRRQLNASAARAAAANAARTLEQRTDTTLAKLPKYPVDQCASMQAMGDEWLQGKAQK